MIKTSFLYLYEQDILPKVATLGIQYEYQSIFYKIQIKFNLVTRAEYRPKS